MITEETLRYLSARRRLEVKCVVYADGYSEESIEIGIKPADWRRLRGVITEAIRANGSFNWRTYMLTGKLDASSIAIIVKDARNLTVRPSGYPGSYEAKVSIK
jgi:hypothetical protein